MSNPFSPSFDLEPESTEGFPPGVVNCSMFVREFTKTEQLDEKQMTWFVEQLEAHVPLYILCLWQGFPEWEITIRGIAERQIQFQVEKNVGSPRYLSFLINGKRLAETKI